MRNSGKPGTLLIFPSDVEARHDKMVGLVETMMTADSVQLAAYGLGWMRRQKRAGAVNRRPTADARQIADTDKQADALVYDWSDSGKCRPTAQLYGLTEDEIRIVGAGEK